MTNDAQELEPMVEEMEPMAEETSEAAAEPGQARGRLTVVRAGVETEEVFEFAPPALIGRFDPEVGPIDVDLGPLPEGSYVSRKHARIECADGVWTITDLGSSNGTYIRRDDFERVESGEIEDGSEIALGNARLLFHVLG
ncbi:MAG: FHA domain-containing protein [Fimbriimonadaceae bacterium]|nr:FHA domain-containing protein [Fimbriimonadaceae bacterium]QYK56155.1 MAG: FHA domain-containing protein [Fimbriimonadaceae bacterium]